MFKSCMWYRNTSSGREERIMSCKQQPPDLDEPHSLWSTLCWSSGPLFEADHHHLTWWSKGTETYHLHHPGTLRWTPGTLVKDKTHQQNDKGQAEAAVGKDPVQVCGGSVHSTAQHTSHRCAWESRALWPHFLDPVPHLPHHRAMLRGVTPLLLAHGEGAMPGPRGSRACGQTHLAHVTPLKIARHTRRAASAPRASC